MSTERRVRLFRNGRNQAVRIPREFDLPGKESLIHKKWHRLIIEPLPRRSLMKLLASLKPLDEIFPKIDDQPPDDMTLLYAAACKPDVIYRAPASVPIPPASRAEALPNALAQLVNLPFSLIHIGRASSENRCTAQGVLLHEPVDSGTTETEPV